MVGVTCLDREWRVGGNISNAATQSSEVTAAKPLQSQAGATIELRSRCDDRGKAIRKDRRIYTSTFFSQDEAQRCPSEYYRALLIDLIFAIASISVFAQDLETVLRQRVESTF